GCGLRVVHPSCVHTRHPGACPAGSRHPGGADGLVPETGEDGRVRDEGSGMEPHEAGGESRLITRDDVDAVEMSGLSIHARVEQLVSWADDPAIEFDDDVSERSLLVTAAELLGIDGDLD